MFLVRIKNFIYILILSLLFIPTVQKQCLIFNIQPLRGDFVLAEEPGFSWQNYFTGEFQEKFEKSIQDNVNLKPLMVRINNQLDFSLFNVPHAEGIVIGKKGYLYELPYIDSYLGKDFAGKNYIDDQLRKLRFLQDELKKKNKNLIFVIAPGKGSFYPEYIPDIYELEKKEITNYDYYVKRSKDLNINLIDFKNYFQLMKDTASYPLYPKCSIHWSTYGYTIAQDSLAKYIKKTQNIDMPDMVRTGMDFPDSTRDTDYDVGEGLNLLWKISIPKMAYPRISFKHVKSKRRPLVLTIGDSFYNCFFDAGISPNMFEQYGYWYYNREIIRDKNREKMTVAQLDLKAEVEKNEVIILFVTERNLGRFPFGFIDNLYDLYFPEKREEKIIHYENMIKTDSAWLNEIRAEAKNKAEEVDSLIRNKAYEYLQSECERFMKIRTERISYHERSIWNSPSMVQQDVSKAHNNGISLKEMIRLDGIFLYVEQEVETSPKKKRLKEIEDNIRTNNDVINKEIKKAEERKITLDEMIMQDSFWTYNNQEEKKRQEIEKYEDQMKNDKTLQKYIIEKAKEKHLTVEEMIKADAKWIYNEHHKQKK